MPLPRQDLEVRYQVFQEFALDDQRNYYDSTARRYRSAASQVNVVRASLSLLTGVASALATYFISANPACVATDAAPECGSIIALTSGLALLSIILPSLAALFGTLADLYQWDRLVKIYDEAVMNIEEADAHSPESEISDDVKYRAAYLAYAEGTFSVMEDESSQWGQAIRTPPQIDEYLAKAQLRAQQVSTQYASKQDDEGAG
jgi:hypothetical protein